MAEYVSSMLREFDPLVFRNEKQVKFGMISVRCLVLMMRPWDELKTQAEVPEMAND